MLLTPRLYEQSKSVGVSPWSYHGSLTLLPQGWTSLPPATDRHVRKMLLVHQAGSVKVGEVVRYGDQAVYNRASSLTALGIL